MIKNLDISEHQIKVGFLTLLIILVVGLNVLFYTGIYENKQTVYHIDGQENSLENINDINSTDVIDYSQLADPTKTDFRDAVATRDTIQKTDRLDGKTYIQLDGTYYKITAEEKTTLTSILSQFSGLILLVSFILGSILSALNYLSTKIETDIITAIDERLPTNPVTQLLSFTTGIVSMILFGFVYFGTGLWVKLADSNHTPTIDASTFNKAETNELMIGITQNVILNPEYINSYIGEYIQTNGEVYHIITLTGFSKITALPKLSIIMFICSLFLGFFISILSIGLLILYIDIVKESDRFSTEEFL